LLYNDEHPHIKQKSIILADECQDLFPTRSKGAVPEFLKFFEKHRHTGTDFFLITQKIRQIDIHLRGLIGDHYDYSRALGQNFVKYRYLPRVIEGDDEKSAEIQKGNKKYPKEIFGLYKSAVIHTHKKKLPLKIVLGAPLMLLFILMMIYFLYSVLFSESTGDVAPSSSSQSSESSDSKEKNIPQKSSPTSYDGGEKMPDLKVNIKFLSDLFIVGEVEMGKNLIAFFEQDLKNGSIRSYNFDTLNLMGFNIRRVGPFLYSSNFGLIGPRPTFDDPSITNVYAGMNDDSDSSKHK
jgi:hypothetical protein